MGRTLGMKLAFDACICQNRLHVGVHNRHVMTGKILDTRVIMDLHLGL